MKNNIILCDFRRTERRKRITEISKIFNDVMQSVWEEEDGEYKISNEELYKLEKEYNALLKEESFYEKCKYWK